MNLRNLLSCMLLGTFCVGVAEADWITSWGPGTSSPTDFVIDQGLGTITIKRGNGNVFKFYSETVQFNGIPGVINNITVDGGASGDFSLLIQHENGGIGASDWYKGDLTYDDGRSTLQGIHISGDLLVGDPADLICNDIVGDIVVEGRLSPIGPGDLQHKLSADSISGNITLGAMRGDIDTDFLGGDFTVYHDPGLGEYAPGDLRIGNDNYDGTMLFNHVPGFDGIIKMDGHFSGRITIQGAMFGRVEIDGDLIAPGRIHVPYRLVRANGGVPPNIHVHGSIVGNGTAPVIEIGPGGLGNDGTIAIAYDGWQTGDIWATGATVEVDSTPCSGNEPTAFVWEISNCLGDINNNWVVELRYRAFSIHV